MFDPILSLRSKYLELLQEGKYSEVAKLSNDIADFIQQSDYLARDNIPLKLEDSYTEVLNLAHFFLELLKENEYELAATLLEDLRELLGEAAQCIMELKKHVE